MPALTPVGSADPQRPLRHRARRWIVWTGALSRSGAYLGCFDGTVKDRGAALRFGSEAAARAAAERRGWIAGTYSVLQEEVARG